jgi:hypothetical protein
MRQSWFSRVSVVLGILLLGWAGLTVWIRNPLDGYRHVELNAMPGTVIEIGPDGWRPAPQLAQPGAAFGIQMYHPWVNATTCGLLAAAGLFLIVARPRAGKPAEPVAASDRGLASSPSEREHIAI